MSGNKGWVASNNPSFLKLTRCAHPAAVHVPISSASRIIKRVVNGVPPQYIALYFAKYQSQLGKFKRVLKGPNCDGGPVLPPNCAPATPPQSSKTMLRTLSGTL